MAFVAVDEDGAEWCFKYKPMKYAYEVYWSASEKHDMHMELPKGSIKKLTGRDLTWDDEPVELGGSDD
jgi:hypothetical protein